MAVMASKDPEKETLTPDPDGVTVDFFTTKDYKPGTVAVWMNGIKKIKEWDDGYDEGGGKKITMKEAPWVGDSLQAEYEPV